MSPTLADGCLLLSHQEAQNLVVCCSSSVMLWNVLCCWPCCVPCGITVPWLRTEPSTELRGNSHDVTGTELFRRIFLTGFWLVLLDFVFFVCFIGFWFGLVIESLGFLWTLSFSHSDLARNNLWKWIFETVSYMVQYKPNACIVSFDRLKWSFWKMGKSTHILCKGWGTLNSVEMCVYEFAVRLYGMLYFS